MRILGIVFAGSATSDAAATATFFSDLFGLEPRPLEGLPASIFSFPDGSDFGVVQVPGEAATRTIGFQVEDIETAAAEIREKGIHVGDIAENALGRYVHFHAPDGHLYELVEKPQAAGPD